MAQLIKSSTPYKPQSSMDLENAINNTPARRYLRALSDEELNQNMEAVREAVRDLILQRLEYHLELDWRSQQRKGRASANTETCSADCCRRVLEPVREGFLNRFAMRELKAHVKQIDENGLYVLVPENLLYFEEAARRIAHLKSKEGRREATAARQGGGVPKSSRSGLKKQKAFEEER